ncbi:MAG: ATP-binding protein [Gammaproteobacteria bacterium]|nr:ATP-binding protein [Gammaproteobacteria bacterium]MDP2142104.1 ATP-binding protein [Gammaproteobacteria bacterium]MDP2347685.1 ATP-binding protein [Gammaproteobacteria bacterium]
MTVSSSATPPAAEKSSEFPVPHSCFCGFHGDPQGRCRCTPEKVQRYLEKISGPLLDRIDLIVNVPRIAHQELRAMAVPENRRKALSEPSESEVARSRIIRCRNLQKAWCGKLNSDLGNPEIEEVCGLDDASEKLLATAVDKLRLSARACHRILKIARTIADMANHEEIELCDLTEAIAYRRMDRYFQPGHQALESILK